MDSVLNTVMRFDEGLMSKKDWIYLQFKKGSNVEISTKNKVDFDRLKFNRMDWEQQVIYEKKCNQKVNCYKLTEKDGSLYNITKTEYNYFLSLNK